MPENVTEQKTSQESSHEGLAGHPLDHSADAAPARQLTRPGDSSPAMPTDGRRSMAPPALALAGKESGGLPMSLKTGIESLAGVSMAGVRVHYGSSEPARYLAGAFARKGEIHIAPGHEHLLPHEAWHIAQQRLGKVRGTVKFDGHPMNEEPGLEAEADRMGQLALAHAPDGPAAAEGPAIPTGQDVDVVQCAPADFAGHLILTVPGRGLTTSHWDMLKQVIRNYAQLQPGDIPGRLQGLQQMQDAAKAWRAAVEFTGIDPTRIASKRRDQAIYLINFERRLMDEWQEVLTQNGQDPHSTGRLQSDQGMAPVEDPLLTRKDANNTFIGFFKPGAQLVKRDNSPIDDPVTGTGCKLLANRSCPDGMSDSDYYEVEEFNYIDQVGEKANIKNGIFFKDRVWVLRTEVQVSHMTRPNPTMEIQDRTDPVQHPLFARMPCKEDVEQNSLGDCWLMAAMAAVADKTPQHFCDMMKDNMDGTVTVQLYDVQPGPVFVPRQITVKKSIVVYRNTNTPGHGGGALWVSLYEKAFAAAGYHGGSDSRLPVERGSYGTIESGQAQFAFRHILGRDSGSGDIKATHPDFQAGDIFRLINQSIDPLDGVSILRQLRPQTGLTLDVNQVRALALSAATYTPAWNECFEPEQPRKEDLERNRQAILDATEVPLQADMATFLDWVRDYALPGKRGTGHYAPWQMDAFHAIQQNVDLGRAMTISSNETVVTHGQNNGLSGENTGKGLVGPHAYVVLDYAPKPLPLLPQNDQLYWVKLRNPWGDVKARNPNATSPGRVYNNKDWEEDLEMDPNVAPIDSMDKDVEGISNKMGAKGGDNPEFWLELSDVTKRFNRYDFVV